MFDRAAKSSSIVIENKYPKFVSVYF